MRTAALVIFASMIASTPASAVSPQPVMALHGMVVSAQSEASAVGRRVLEEGGNAIDAAVAVGYALAVTNPCCGNIGGGGFASLHLADGRDIFINFREKAPAAASADMFLDANGEVVKGASLTGYLAVAVPGTVLGLETMREKYGTLPRARLMAPAIELAEKGFVLSKGDADILAGSAEAFLGDAAAQRIFLREGKPFLPGERLVQTDLAQTLKAIAEQGPDAFYKGVIADQIVSASRLAGGRLSKPDFAGYSIEEATPVTCEYRGYVLLSAPPPSSGGIAICEILNVLKAYPLGQLGFHSAQAIHLAAEAMRHAFVDRNFLLGDPDFVENPLGRILSAGHAEAIRAKIDPARASDSKEVGPGVPPHEGAETTHFSIVDKAGNAVAVTYTLNALFGAKVIAGDTGFFLNDEMDDFTIKSGAANLFGLVQGKRNAIAPGKRPLSSMSPTIVLKDGRVFMVLGSPGGSRIISTIVQVVSNVVDFGMDVQEAVDAPRVHHQWLPDELFVEPLALSPDTRNLLVGMGYKVREQTPWGAAEAILIPPVKASDRAASSSNDAIPALNAEPGLLYGANDNRRPAGAAVGY
jgi:gamma-glutamyltranspeptidase / glutathione hydrolase